MKIKKANKFLNIMILTMIICIISTGIAMYNIVSDDKVSYSDKEYITGIIENKYSKVNRNGDRIYTLELKNKKDINAGMIILNIDDEDLYFSDQKEIIVTRINKYNKHNCLVGIDYKYESIYNNYKYNL